MEAETPPLAPFLDGSDATLSEELPAAESVVSTVFALEGEAAPLLPESESVVSPVFAWEAEAAPLLPEPESLGSGVVERGVLEIAGGGTTGESSTGDETTGESAAELATAGERVREHDTLGLVSSTIDSAAGLEAWGGDDTGGGDDKGRARESERYIPGKS